MENACTITATCKNQLKSRKEHIMQKLTDYQEKLTNYLRDEHDVPAEWAILIALAVDDYFTGYEDCYKKRLPMYIVGLGFTWHLSNEGFEFWDGVYEALDSEYYFKNCH
jgi:hypothetical protein